MNGEPSRHTAAAAAAAVHSHTRPQRHTAAVTNQRLACSSILDSVSWSLEHAHAHASCTRAHTHTFTHARMRPCTHTCDHARTHARVHAPTHLRTRAHAHAPTHPRTHAHAHSVLRSDAPPRCQYALRMHECACMRAHKLRGAWIRACAHAAHMSSGSRTMFECRWPSHEMRTHI